jgi:putative transposase
LGILSLFVALQSGNRDEVHALLYAKARTQKPERWSGKTRNRHPAGPVWLNPERENSASEIRDAA